MPRSPDLRLRTPALLADTTRQLDGKVAPYAANRRDSGRGITDPPLHGRHKIVDRYRFHYDPMVLSRPGR